MKTVVKELEQILKENLKEIVLKQDYKLMEKIFSNALAKEEEQLFEFWMGGINCTEDGGKSFDQYLERFNN